MKDKCVCWNEKKNRCEALKLAEFDRGHSCRICTFYKTEETYIRQTGRPYDVEVERAIALYKDAQIGG